MSLSSKTADEPLGHQALPRRARPRPRPCPSRPHPRPSLALHHLALPALRVAVQRSRPDGKPPRREPNCGSPVQHLEVEFSDQDAPRAPTDPNTESRLGRLPRSMRLLSRARMLVGPGSQRTGIMVSAPPPAVPAHRPRLRLAGCPGPRRGVEERRDRCLAPRGPGATTPG